MERNLTVVQVNSQEKFTYVQVIKEAMDARGWNAARLSRESGVNEASVSRALKGGRDLKGVNLYDVLRTLNLINTDPSSHKNDCPLAGCDQKMIDICRDVKELIESKTHWGASLEANIGSFKKGLDTDKKLTAVEQRVQILEKVTSSGSSSGTQKPAVRTGRKRKAG